MNKITLKLNGANDFFTQEAYKTLRTNLLFSGQDIRVVAVTSCNENEGKTTVVLNLAKSLADLGKRVLVIDADMRKSIIAGRHTNAKNPLGLSEILTGMCSFTDALHVTRNEHLHLIFSGKYPPNPVELLSGQYFARFIQEARNVYDYVLIDTPPLGQVIDAAVLAPLCDGAILVISGQTSRIKQAREVIAQLSKTGCKILGTVRNQIRTDRSSGKYYGSRN